MIAIAAVGEDSRIQGAGLSAQQLQEWFGRAQNRGYEKILIACENQKLKI